MVRPHPGPRLRHLILLASVFALLTQPAAAGSVTLAWDPNTESDLAGYVVSWGTKPGVYTSSRDVGNATGASVPDLSAGQRFYFAVQAYNTSGLTSPYSAEVSALIPDGNNNVPAVSSVTPATGPEAGGTAVTITGQGFLPNATVAFGSSIATSVTVLNAVTITAVTPAHAPGLVDVVVQVPGRPAATLPQGFTYTPPGLSITSLSPRWGPVTGGTVVAITGSEFEQGAQVTFDGQVASDVQVIDAATIVAVAPPHARAAVDVVVRNADGRWAVVTKGFTYLDDDPTADTDADGLPDLWERTYGLDPGDATGVNGAAGDADADGTSNLDEWRLATHPRGLFKRYFAEGISSAFFTTTFALMNPAEEAAVTVLSFAKSNGTRATLPLTVAAHSRSTIDAHDLPQVEGLAFSTTIESDRPLVADRTLLWDPEGYGGHAETAMVAPATEWYLAEGATHSGFDLFYLIQNPGDVEAQVEIRYLLPQGAPIVRTYGVAAHSRFNIWVDLEDQALADTDVSAVVTATNGVPVIVERSMYLNAGDRPFGAGHNSAGIRAPATKWFLAEGATGAFFDMFVLIANPNPAPADVTATFLLPSGETLTQTYQVAGNSRFNVWVDHAHPRLADTAVSTTIESTNGVPLIVERTMWWPGGGDAAGWTEAHNAPGTTETSPRWAMANGEVGGVRNTATYVLLANTAASPATVRVTLVFEDATTIAREFPVAGSSRFNVDVGYEFPAARGKRFGAVVEGLGTAPPPLVVECAMYWDAGGVTWAAGTDAVATPLGAASPASGPQSPTPQP
jgi:hypothetical protein